MFAIGHFAIGYLVAKGTNRLLNTKVNLPLVLVLSVLPDIDLLLQQFNDLLFMHRGPLHSIVTISVLTVPFLLIYGKRVVPYYAVLLSHSLIGDLFAGGIEMFWPLSQGWWGNSLLEVGSAADILAELVLFAAVTPIMFKKRDLQRLLKPRNHNLLLLIAIGAVSGPIFSSFLGFESSLHFLLLPPSIFWLILFCYSIVIEIRTSRVPFSSK